MHPDLSFDVFKGVVRPFDRIVLVANSPEAIMTNVNEAGTVATLYIFFNDARRVLHSRFAGDAVLILRSGKRGPSVIRRDRLDAVFRHFDPTRLQAIVNLRVDDTEMMTDGTSHEGVSILKLELQRYFEDRYTAGKIPSSGYAMAAWLRTQFPDKTIILRGFNALRSVEWKVFDIHDWVFEQTALRLMIASGSISIEGASGVGRSRLSALQAEFPQADVEDLLAVQAEVLSDRIDHANSFIDQLWSATKLSRGLRKWLRFGR